MYTTSSLFLRTLAQVGITHAFVNWGSDHPALLEDLERQRVEDGKTALEIITCPNEMVALSAAQGYAQVTGKPAAVIVHVEVGTQALAGAIHNVDVGRVPVLIYAGSSPFTYEGELKGSRNEWIMWLQDFPDQAHAVRQHVRHVAQIDSPVNLTQTVRRALQIATSEPKGPVYLWARREVMEQDIDEALMRAPISMLKWPAICPAALSPQIVSAITSALLASTQPLILTSNIGRSSAAIKPLLALSAHLAIPIISTVPSTTNCPHSHPYFLGTTYLAAGTHHAVLQRADVILIVDTEVPWIPGNRDAQGNFEKPSESARIFVLDGGDPLKSRVGMWHVDAEAVALADAGVALGQIEQAVRAGAEGVLDEARVKEMAGEMEKLHEEWIAGMDKAEGFGVVVPLPLTRVQKGEQPPSPPISPISPVSKRRKVSFSRKSDDMDTATDDTRSDSPSTLGEDAPQSILMGPTRPVKNFTTPQIVASLRRAINELVPPSGALVLNETVTKYPLIWEHTRAEGRIASNLKSSASADAGKSIGGVITSRGSSLGWAIGASVGTILGSRVTDAQDSIGDLERRRGFDFAAAVVGDGCFMFGVPSTVFWMARKYNAPFLTVILNNSGWGAPMGSMLGVYPHGLGSAAGGQKLSVGFGPNVPDHSGVAVAASAGWAWGRRVSAHGIEQGGVRVQEDETNGRSPKEVLDMVIREAVRVVLEERRCAVVDCVLDAI
ncbi:hypothetical protein CONPUDRAFT_104954 [Coniophora puteana RWD-64-598 SS2]|uniref:Thiamin diphosphate-binding protein n=1 Tax=Coniophora puteana (strain RWD-64-598) TaxID=741705 RepID=A0A5M3MQU3_CONPW|nr:uncharacterized protein CONPUDRAFT_104954 [Coniophora puteana RWD-64-598 SS2]EIW81543.1 hypothetical protein CONPUDRAFT_104954 [Coniophora puteana RWD-64-598 SS2]